MRITSEEQDAIIRNRASGKCAAERTGFVGVVHFRGPRGKEYRPIRTPIFLNLDEVIAAIEGIRSKRYSNGAFPTTDDILEIDAYGKIAR